MFAAGGAVVALTLAVLAIGLAEPPAPTVRHPHGSRAGVQLVQGKANSWERSGQRSECLRLRSFTPDEWAGALGAPHGFQLYAQGFSPRARTGFQADPQAVHRAVRERLDALVTARVRVMRAPTISISAGYPSDRPPLVTRPLRGPPARA